LRNADDGSAGSGVTERGVQPVRLTARGYGHSVPIADSRLEAGRTQNRRVKLVRK